MNSLRVALRSVVAQTIRESVSAKPLSGNAVEVLADLIALRVIRLLATREELNRPCPVARTDAWRNSGKEIL